MPLFYSQLDTVICNEWTETIGFIIIVIMSERKKTLNFGNSRIQFGNIINVAVEQGDVEGLELILSQDGGMCKALCAGTIKSIFIHYVYNLCFFVLSHSSLA